MSNTESNFFCLIQRVISFLLIQRVILMYWYEICCHAVTFFLCNFLNIFFNSFLPSYMWKIYSKFHLNLLSGCREKWWTDVHSHGTAYFIYRYWIYWLQHPPNQFFILCKRPTKTIKLTSDRVHTDMIVLKFGDIFFLLQNCTFLQNSFTIKDFS